MILDRRFYAAGQRIFSEGDDASCVYLVQRGMVRISKGRREEEVTLALIGPNGLFGEMSIVDDNPAPPMPARQRTPP
ncbi:cyclic nucleotide-binding domain-containing protein [Aerophototrophica crusticola]|uniref:Cyclic nucleotide-binding domain-containing protein n=1 Tax=Aerophototrophica crusticola TaxID=1709002 RepID=A0A858R9L2_9PROT|nr:cyclic nucleotide-binding domain-containing protein [Rhodospirillaceae bacterium B3]